MDIVLRAVLAFGFIFFLTRVVGRRELSSLEPFDLIMLIVLGDLVQQGVTQSDYSVTGLVLAAGTIALMRSASRTSTSASSASAGARGRADRR